MKAVSGYRDAKAASFNSVERLPAGGYVLKILDVKEENYSWGDVVVLRFDIAEGEYTGFFDRQYKEMPDEYKKWKGTHRLNVPQPGGDTEEDRKKYNRSLSFFKAQIEAVNKSNGINIDCSSEWDTAALKGRIVGALFGNKEWDYEGRTGWYTDCRTLIEADKIRSGDFTVPKDKPLPKKETIDMTDFEEIVSGDVPF